MERKSLALWHSMFVYFVSQYIIETSLHHLDFFLEMYGDLFLFYF